jgi:protoporphyrinogen oxidase
MSGRAAVLGAGVAGLVAARELAKRGMQVDVYERWRGLGGQAATLDVGEGVLLERYYHHLFTSDRHIADLYRELHLPDAIEWLPSSVAFFCQGRSHAFTTPLDLLRFSPLSLRARLRMGLAVLMLQRRQREVGQFECQTAREWILREMGREPWQKVWEPLLRGKFGDRTEDISMAWLWSKLTLRRPIKGEEARGEVLGYPRGSFEGLFRALAHEIEERGGRVLTDCPAARLSLRGASLAVVSGAPGSFRRGHDPQGFKPAGEGELYDGIIATVPNGVFERLLEPGLADALGGDYLARVRGVEYQAAVCLLLELDRSYTPFYWTSIADRDLPFVGLIEQTNLIPPERFNRRRFLYVANYVAHDDPLLGLSLDELIDCYEPGLRRVRPDFSRDWIRGAWLHREPDAQPIVTVGYRERMPPLETRVPGLVLANTSQVYPEDRGTNYAVELGRRAARRLARAPEGAAG